MELVSKKYYYDIDLRGNRLLNFAVESVSGELPSEAKEGAVIYHAGEGVMYQRLRDGWKVIASGKDLEDALSKVSEDLQALSKDMGEALDTKAGSQELLELSNIVSKEIADRESSDDSINEILSNHVSDTSNPHGVTKEQLGLENVDNTSDMDKPISAAVQNALNGKAGTSVATQSANGLMSSTDKSKLDEISAGAQVNVIETVMVDNTALGVSGKVVNIDLSDYAKKSDVTTVMRYMGSVSTVTSLPTTATLGDTYNVVDTNANYTWDGSAWDLIGSTVDLSGYATKTEVDSALAGKSDTGHTHDEYLPLSAGSNKKLTGVLYANKGVAIDNEQPIKSKNSGGVSIHLISASSTDNVWINQENCGNTIIGGGAVIPFTANADITTIGLSAKQWKAVYGKTIYQNGIQVANKSDIPDISGKSDVGHTHDDRYYTESEVESKLSGRLPNFTNNLGSTNGGNPRQVKFITVDYNSKATYFKMGAMCCHDNGVSYQFLEDIIIGVTTTGTITCNIYKYCQQSCGTASYNLVDGLERYYGDVFYVHDETNKIVDFYILMGQYTLGQFTPPTRIGNTSLSYVTPLTGTPTYHTSGTRIWANGIGATYVTTNDIPTITKSTADPSGGKDGDIWFRYE